MPLRVQPAGIVKRRMLHPQLLGAGVHPLHKRRFASAHQLGHRHCCVVGRRNADGPDHLVQRKLLARLEPDLAAAHAVGVLADRNQRVHRQLSLLHSLKRQQQGHHLGDGRNGHRRIRVLLVEHPAALLLHEQCRPAVQRQIRLGVCLQRIRRAQGGACRPRFRLCPVGGQHRPQPKPLCRPEGQREQPEAEHRRAERRKSSLFHLSYLPASVANDLWLQCMPPKDAKSLFSIEKESGII